MLLEDFAGISVDFAKCDRLHTCPLKAKAEPANAGKKIQYSGLICAFWYDFHYDQTPETLRLLRLHVCA